jgi:hypothetical protein
MVSFDVVALYPSIPIPKALEVIRERLTCDPTLESRTKWTVDQIIALLNIALETYFKTLDGTIYKQHDGTPIGKSISGPIAGIYMNWFEESFILCDSAQFKPAFWKRYRDDIFLIWQEDHHSLQDFLVYLNSHEPKIQFTMELESNNQLPFLDLLISRNDCSLSTSIYRKPTHTQCYINWRSNHSKSMLLGTLKGLIHRAHLLTDKKEDLLRELLLLEDVFIANGYPEKLVKKTVEESWSSELFKAVNHNKASALSPTEFFNILHAPFVEGFSHKVQRELRKVNVGFVPQKGITFQSLICKLRPSSPLEKQKNVVYGIRCSTCNLWYIGETSQRFETRRKQHQGDIRRGNSANAFFCHLKDFPQHSIDWENFMFFKTEQIWDKRKFTESIIINAMNPAKELTTFLNIDKGKEIDDCWLEFAADIREEAFKKWKSRMHTQNSSH